MASETSVTRPAQYTASTRSTSITPSASTKVVTLRTGTSMPAARNRRAKPTAASAGSAGTGHRRGHDVVEALTAHTLLVLAVLEHGAEGGVGGGHGERPGRARRGGPG